ncbi:dTDP-4-dehydrorhamnose reductase [Guptibacillus hwajinpoensis]|nr:dTDP-4-dehydrorhamnose reductase [Alkalihalobacillus macyae]
MVMESRGGATKEANSITKKLMIIGAGGQVGLEFVRLLKGSSHQVFSYTREDLDITDYEKVSNLLNHVRPDVIVNCAAFTSVDEAEREQDRAFQINAHATKWLAEETRRINASLVFLSTNYVFNGEADLPYSEDDREDPINAYGRSKLAGEEFVRQTLNNYFIIRTSWVYGWSGQNYFLNFLDATETKETIGVVDVQISSPTYTEDLVHIVMKLVETDQFGTYHVTNRGSCSRYEFAKAILDIGAISSKLEKIAPDYQMASRPAYSVLKHKRLNQAGMTPRHWKEALVACMTVESEDHDGEF